MQKDQPRKTRSRKARAVAFELSKVLKLVKIFWDILFNLKRTHLYYSILYHGASCDASIKTLAITPRKLADGFVKYIFLSLFTSILSRRKYTQLYTTLTRLTPNQSVPQKPARPKGVPRFAAGWLLSPLHLCHHYHHPPQEEDMLHSQSDTRWSLPSHLNKYSGQGQHTTLDNSRPFDLVSMTQQHRPSSTHRSSSW